MLTVCNKGGWTKANGGCWTSRLVLAVQVVKVTDGQFGFLKLDFDQVEVALIAVSTSREDNSATTRQLLVESIVQDRALNENGRRWEPKASPPALILGSHRI